MSLPEVAANAGYSDESQRTKDCEQMSYTTAVFSSLLESRPIEIEVGSAPTATFFVHESSLCMESEKYRTLLQGTGDWKEINEGKITIAQENPEVFRSFADYLYRDDWCNSKADDESDLVHLARLYCLGDRLIAKRFQKRVLSRFAMRADFGERFSEDAICGVLEIVFTELPERNEMDPLQRRAAKLGASRLFDLQKHLRFANELSRDVPGITRAMCLNMAPPEPYKPLKRPAWDEDEQGWLL